MAMTAMGAVRIFGFELLIRTVKFEYGDVLQVQLIRLRDLATHQIDDEGLVMVNWAATKLANSSGVMNFSRLNIFLGL